MPNGNHFPPAILQLTLPYKVCAPINDNSPYPESYSTNTQSGNRFSYQETCRKEREILAGAGEQHPTVFDQPSPSYAIAWVAALLKPIRLATIPHPHGWFKNVDPDNFGCHLRAHLSAHMFHPSSASQHQFVSGL
jgi:hypothetical protein